MFGKNMYGKNMSGKNMSDPVKLCAAKMCGKSHIFMNVKKIGGSILFVLVLGCGVSTWLYVAIQFIFYRLSS